MGLFCLGCFVPNHKASSSYILSISTCTLSFFKIILYPGFENSKFKKYNLKFKISFQKRKSKMKKINPRKNIQNTKSENTLRKRISRIKKCISKMYSRKENP